MAGKIVHPTRSHPVAINGGLLRSQYELIILVIFFPRPFGRRFPRNRRLLSSISIITALLPGHQYGIGYARFTNKSIITLYSYTHVSVTRRATEVDVPPAGRSDKNVRRTVSIYGGVRGGDDSPDRKRGGLRQVPGTDLGGARREAGNNNNNNAEFFTVTRHGRETRLGVPVVLPAQLPHEPDYSGGVGPLDTKRYDTRLSEWVSSTHHGGVSTELTLAVSVEYY